MSTPLPEVPSVEHQISQVHHDGVDRVPSGLLGVDDVEPLGFPVKAHGRDFFVVGHLVQQGEPAPERILFLIIEYSLSGRRIGG